MHGTFFGSPHSALGRSGDVCPFTGTSLAQGCLYASIIPQTATKVEIERTIRGAKGAFHDLVVPANAPPILKAFLIAFPDVPEERYATCIDDVQKELKMDYVQSGMMLGGFHPKQEGGGLHNTSFSPFKTALPILAIRHMHKADAVFLHGDPIHIKAYLNEFGEDGYKRMKKLIETKYAGADCSQRLTELENCKPL